MAVTQPTSDTGTAAVPPAGEGAHKHHTALPWGWETGTRKALRQLPQEGNENDKMRALIAGQRRVVPSSLHPVRMCHADVSGWGACQQAFAEPLSLDGNCMLAKKLCLLCAW